MNAGVCSTIGIITIAALFCHSNPTDHSVYVCFRCCHDFKKPLAKLWLNVQVWLSTGVFFVFALLGGLIFKYWLLTIGHFACRRPDFNLVLPWASFIKGLMKVKPACSDSRQLRGKIAKGYISVIPLAIPLWVGPGLSPTVMILTSEAATAWHLINCVCLLLFWTTVPVIWRWFIPLSGCVIWAENR